MSKATIIHTDHAAKDIKSRTAALTERKRILKAPAHSERQGMKRDRDAEVNSTNVIIKRLSISSALAPSQCDEMYEDVNKDDCENVYSSDENTFPIVYDADNERECDDTRQRSGSNARYHITSKVRDEYSHSNTSAPCFAFHSGNNNGNCNEEENHGESDSDPDYMLPRMKDVLSNKLVRQRNPLYVDTLIDDVIRKSARRSSISNLSIVPTSKQSDFHMPASLGPHPLTDRRHGLREWADASDDDEDGENNDAEQIFGLDFSLYEYHQSLQRNKGIRDNHITNDSNMIVQERFTGNVSHSDCFEDESHQSSRTNNGIVLSPPILKIDSHDLEDEYHDEMSGIMMEAIDVVDPSLDAYGDNDAGNKEIDDIEM